MNYRKSHISVENVLLRVRFPEAKSILNMIKRRHGTFLEIGCGDGSAATYLALHGMHEKIIGIDLDRSAIQHAQQVKHYLKQQRMSYVIGSATYLPLRSETIDSVLCHQVLEHIPDPYAVLTECNRIMSTHGEILITTPSKTFSPLSSDWFENRIFGYLHVDKYAGHLHRFNPKTLLQFMREKGLAIRQIQFHQQSFTCLMVLIFTLLQTRRLRTDHTNVTARGTNALPTVAFMISYLFENTLLARLPRGSNIVILASK